jgi:beta-phosphoglucomutase-like phosphatase (HAD superfamily)
MIRALIFDFNGVIADDDPIHMEAFRRTAAEEGLTFTDEEYLDVYLPLNDRDCFTTLFAKYALPLPPEKLRALIERKGHYYYQAIEAKPVLFADAPEAIRAAAERYPLAIASGARFDEIQHILKQAHLDSCFDAIVAAEHVEHGKPHPEPFLKAHQQLNDRHGHLAISDCVAIEDSVGGIQSAHRAGMRCLGIAHSYGPERLRDAEAEWVINSISDFISWMKKVSL